MNTYKELESVYRQNMFARENKKESLVEYYRELEDKTITDENEKNLYHLAAQFLDSEAINYLANEGIKSRTDDYGNTPLHILVKTPYGNDNTNFQTMEEAIYKTTKALLDLGINPKKKNDSGEIAYMEAGKACMYPFIKAVAEAGVKMDAIEKEEKNILHLITDLLYHRKSVRGFPENAYQTIKILVESGHPDPEDKDMFGRTPLQYAQSSGVKEVAALLSGDESATKTGGMSLNEAVLKNDTEAVAALLEQGADVQELSEDKRTPLMYACEYPRPEIVKLLLKAGANPNYTVGETGATPLSYLLTKSIHNLGRGFKGGSQPPKDIRNILRLLLDAGADPNISIDHAGNTPLIYVANMDYFADLNNSLAEELIEGGADINKANLEGQTPLMVFAIKGNEMEHNIAELLLESGADTYLTDKRSNTALMYAASNSKHMSAKRIAELILENGYKELDRTNNAGKTAMDIAVEKNNEALVKLLLNYM